MPRPLLALALLALAAAAPAREADGYVPPALVRLQAAGDVKGLIGECEAADWTIVARDDQRLEVVMPTHEARRLARLQRVRDAFGHEAGRPLRPGSEVAGVEVLEEDLDSQLAGFGEDAGAYHTYAEVQEELAAYLADHGEIMRREVIGTSGEGREIVAVELTGPGDAAGRPATLITGLHHAREWISVEVPMATIQMLVEGYGQDAWVTEMLDTRRVWVVPVVNPDGHVYSQTQKRMWRKNRRENSWWARGVDNNRNYGYNWGQGGASGNPWSDTYRGPEAFSEPENQAIRDLALREGFVSSLSFHSYSQLVLWPWGYTYDPAPDAAVLRQHGEAMAAFNGYEPKQSSGLYPTSGDFCDWFYGATGALSYTFELGTRFVPQEEKIPEIVAKNLGAVRYFLEHTVTPR